MDINTIREKYPQYGDLSDKQLADGLHSKFYSDIPQEEFYKKIGFAAPEVKTEEAKAETPQTETPQAETQQAEVPQAEAATPVAQVAPTPTVAQQATTPVPDIPVLTPQLKTKVDMQPKFGELLKGTQSVMHGAELEAPLPSTSKAPVNPQFRAAFNAQWDAASPEQRASLVNAPGIAGQLARDRAGIFERADKTTENMPATAPSAQTLGKLDPRAEIRRAAVAERLIAQGESPESADLISRLAAERGVAPGKELQAIASATPSDLDDETKKLFQQTQGLNNPLVRGTAKAVLGTGKAVTGLAELYSDLLGTDVPSGYLKKGSQYLRNKEESIGEKGTYLEKSLEGAVNSLAQQLPLMIASGGTSEVIPLAGMILSTFGQEYTDGKAQGLDNKSAALRAAWFGLFEGLGEKFGFGGELKAYRSMLKGKTNDAVLGFLSNTAKKQIPGELFTTTGQFVWDKFAPGMGLAANATIQDYFKQAGDTIVQTIMQGGLMAGGAKAMGGARDFVNDKGYTEAIAGADAEAARTAALQKAETMFAPKAAQPVTPPTEATTPPVTPPTEATTPPVTPPVQSATGEPIATVPLDTAEKQQAAVAQGRIEPTIGAGSEVNQQKAIKVAIEQTMENFGVSRADATAMVEDLVARGEFNVKPKDNEAVTGVNEPSISVPSAEAAAAQGVTPPNISGLATDTGGAGVVAGGEGAQRAALGEIPTLTERATPPSTPVEQAQAKLAAAEAAVVEAKSTKDKAKATQARNTARQELKKAQKTTVETPVIETPVEAAATEAAPVVKKRGRPAKAVTTEAAPVEAAAPKQKGRTAAVIPPELVEQKREVKNEQTKVRNSAIRQVGAHTANLNTPVDISEAVDDADAQKIIKNHSKRRVDEVEALFELSKNRVPGVAQAATAALADPNITELEKTLAAKQLTDKKQKGVKTAATVFREQKTVDKELAKQEQEERKAKAAARAAERTPEALAAKAEEAAKVKAERLAERKKVKAENQARQERKKAVAEANRIEREAKKAKAIEIEKNVPAAAPEAVSKRKASKKKSQITAVEKEAVNAQKVADLLEAKRAREEDIFGDDISKSTPIPTAASLEQRVKDIEQGEKLNTFTTATQAINHIAHNGSRFQRTLANRLKPFLKNVTYIVAQKESDLPDIRTYDGKSVREEFKNADGAFVTANNGKQYLILRGENFEGGGGGLTFKTLLHEGVHGATVAQINEYERLTKAGLPVPTALKNLINELISIRNEVRTAYQAASMDAKFFDGKPVSEALESLFAKKEEGGVGVLDNLKEFVAYGMTEPEMQQFMQGVEGKARKGAPGFFKSMFDRFINSLMASLGLGANHQSAFLDLMLVTQGLMKEQAKSPAAAAATISLAAKKVKIDKHVRKIETSNDVKEIVENVESLVPYKDWQDYKDLYNARFDAMGSAFITKTLATMQSADIIRWAENRSKPLAAKLSQIDTYAQDMAGMRMQMLASAAKIGDKFGAYIRATKGGSTTIANAMHYARLTNITPTAYNDVHDALINDQKISDLRTDLQTKINLSLKAKTQGGSAQAVAASEKAVSAARGALTRRTREIEQLYVFWDKLGETKDGHATYAMVRDFYKNGRTLTRTLLNDQISQLKIDGTVDDASTPKGKLVKSIRRMQEGGDFKGAVDEYFPFMREGPYWLRINGPSGRELHMFETGTARNVYEIKRARQMGSISKEELHETGVFDSGDDINAMRKKYGQESKMLAEMFEIIDNATAKNTFTAADKETLKDQLYQTYLMTMPEESYRKQFLHSENVTGFSADVFNNFKVSATRLANQASKLKYGVRLQDTVQSARDSLFGDPQKKKLELFINEFDKRVEQELMPPEESKLANNVNKFAYYWLLTGAASAATQMASIPIMVMPTLNVEYGYGKSALTLAKYANIWKSMGVTKEDANGDVVYTAPSIGASSRVKENPLLKKAFEEFVRRGLTTDTNTSVLTNRNRTPVNSYDSVPGVALRVTANTMSALFNGAERISREMSAMMVFELEYAKSKDFDAAIQKAVDVTQELLGRYDNFNRPRIARGFVGKTVGQFKQYALTMTSFFFRNLKGIVNFTNPKEMLPSFHRLSGVLLTGALFHGFVGMPLYTAMCSTIDTLLDSFGDEEERKRRRNKNAFTADNSNLRFRYEFLPRMFGEYEITGLDGRQHKLSTVLEKGAISELTDMNIGSRTSFDNLWWKPTGVTKTTREAFINFAIQNLGPGASTGLNMTGAAEDFDNGRIMRGMEKLVPAFYKNPLIAARVKEEGYKTAAGHTMLKKEEVSTANIIAQATGLQSTRVTRLQEEAFESNNEVKKATFERQKILTHLDDVMLNPTSEAKDKKSAINQITQHNRRYPVEGVVIDIDTIMTSIDRALEQKGLTFRGQYIKEDLIPYLLPLRKAASPVPKRD